MSDVSSNMNDARSEDQPDFAGRYNQFIAANEKKQMQLIPELVDQGSVGLEILMKFLHQGKENPQVIHGMVYQTLFAVEIPIVQDFLAANFSQGILSLRSDQGIDYTELRDLLVKQDFLEADRLTMQKLCEIAGAAATKRKWLYFSEVESIPIVDLRTINDLWLFNSQGKFGFSVQRELWLALNQEFPKLWEAINWKSGNNWTRYPQQFTWNLSAPKGHLPLSNQLRGVQVIKAIFAHPAWQREN
ncbi:MAG: hypothetical protein HC916_14865 [Coleofasciculaceae cyanobacterium SM2_1_6]|nr:hypothetical protein [Coleofasciculaceae cyanobacterium SM2_1_6]